MRKKVIKIISQIVLGALIFVGLWIYTGFVLTPKSYDALGGDYYFAYNSIFDEKRDSIDVMFSGNSNTFKSCIPMEFYERTGATCYNIGGSSQSANSMKARIKSVLKKQSPKLIIFDVDCLYRDNIFFTGSNKYRILPLIAPVMYHNRWSELKFSDFFSKSVDDRAYMKGYVLLNEVSEYQIDENYMKEETAEIEKISKSVYKDMLSIKKMCDDRNIKMLFISAPTPATWTNKKHNGVQALADEFGIDYLDMNMPDVEFGFDYSKHIADAGYHCNYEGSVLVTKFVSDYVNSHYQLDDRRTDENYENWNEQMKEYKEYVKQVTQKGENV